MAVAISDLLSAAGRTIAPARRKASITLGPVILAARPGSTKIPLPIIAPMLMVNTAYSPRFRSSPLAMHSLGGVGARSLRVETPPRTPTAAMPAMATLDP